MKPITRWLLWGVGGTLVWFVPSLHVQAEPVADQQGLNAENAAKLEFFEKKVRPLLVAHCYNCHSADTKASGGLRLDEQYGLLDGGASGPAVVPGGPEHSLLLESVRYEGLEMPPEKQLSAEEIEILTTWVRDGAVWPQQSESTPTASARQKYEQLKKEHWAWRSLQEATPPTITGDDWSRSPIDRFVLVRLKEAGLEPGKDASKADLIRRVTFDLTGLPPMQQDIHDFLQDESSDAFAKVVDRLLASSAFGERWGRHWLDVARYGESTGSSRNLPYPHAWRYRDYVIGSLNADKPFDHFIREQIAGDLLPADNARQAEEQLIATGFLALGVKDVNQRFKVRYDMDNVDEQIDTVSRSILGLTVSCARCHDHKFDPIPTQDYYALAGIFTSTKMCDGLRNKMGGGGLDYYDTEKLIKLQDKSGPEQEESRQEIAAKVDAKQAELKKARNQLAKVRDQAKPNDGQLKKARQKVRKIQAEIIAFQDPAAFGEIAYGVRDAESIGDTQIRIRGEAERKGDVAPRGFLSLLPNVDDFPIPAEQSGRLELANWLTDPKNPLTPRVAVNRIWQRLFGEGLVSTVDNFGVTGDSPTHPELLDYLALQFMRRNWSQKAMIREVVLSRTYQLSATATPNSVAVDPANRLLWRHEPRRLDAEEIRDSLLVAANRLQQTVPYASAAHELDVREIRNNGPEAENILKAAATADSRSVYLPQLRGITPDDLQAFDFVEQGMVTGKRDVTTVPPQALYLLNAPFVREQALHLAQRFAKDATLDDEERIKRVYLEAFQRSPTEQEVGRARQFLTGYSETIQPSQSTAVANSDVASVDESVANDASAVAPDWKTAALVQLCQALFCSAEFRYVR